MDVFADKSTLACTALALMDNYANKPPHLRNIESRANWRVPYAALADVFSDRPTLARTSAASWTLPSTGPSPTLHCIVRLLAGSASGLHGQSRQWLHIGGYCGGPHGQFRRQAHHPRNIGLRANWRLLHAALMDDFAAQSSLALTAVALMDSFAYMPTIRTTLYCELMGVYCMRSSWTISPTGRLHCAGTGAAGPPSRGRKTSPP
jgi:hypothetical protein